jgi:non-canonical purine NTP pyrophosphatase (RdgB/HAM1 family)
VKIYYATTNKGKVKSMERWLKQYGMSVEQLDILMPESRSYNPEEIAVEKVVYAFNKTGKPVAALDAGFFIPSLKGFPKTQVNLALDTIEVAGLLKLVKGESRDCMFVEALAFTDGGMENPITFVETIRGTLSKNISNERKEGLWSDLGLIFIPEGCDKVLAEMSDEEHREWHNQVRDNSNYKRFAEWYAKNYL